MERRLILTSVAALLAGRQRLQVKAWVVAGLAAASEITRWG